MSGSSGKPSANERRAAAVQRLKAAVAERRQDRARDAAGKPTRGGIKAGDTNALRRNRTGA